MDARGGVLQVVGTMAAERVMVHHAYTRQQLLKLQNLKKIILKGKKWLYLSVKDFLKIISIESFMFFLLYFPLF